MTTEHTHVDKVTGNPVRLNSTAASSGYVSDKDTGNKIFANTGDQIIEYRGEGCGNGHIQVVPAATFASQYRTK